jgi:prevent-host-death family protein
MDLVEKCAMTPVNVHEAKTHLSRLLIRVAQGEEILAKAGHPIAKLVSLRDSTHDRVPGMHAGQVWISEVSMRRCRRRS